MLKSSVILCFFTAIFGIFTFKTVLSHQGFSKNLAYKMAYLGVSECRFSLILLGFSRVCTYLAVANEKYFNHYIFHPEMHHFALFYTLFGIFVILHNFRQCNKNCKTRQNDAKCCSQFRGQTAAIFEPFNDNFVIGVHHKHTL